MMIMIVDGDYDENNCGDDDRWCLHTMMIVDDRWEWYMIDNDDKRWWW